MPRDDIAISELGTAADSFQSDSHTDSSAGGAKQLPIPSQDGRLDHFIQRDGMVFAGTHLIVDLWEARHLDDIQRVETVLTDAAAAAGATVLHCHLHRFSPEGVSGVLVLAESHISIHTWPEMGYAALDVFMCGGAEPLKAVDVLKAGFEANVVKIDELQRGRVR